MSSDNNIAIRVRGLGKKYQLGGSQEQYHTLRDAIVNLMKAPFKRFFRAPLSEEFLSAQRMCHFMWSKGEVVGIVGLSGAGKRKENEGLSRVIGLRGTYVM